MVATLQQQVQAYTKMELVVVDVSRFHQFPAACMQYIMRHNIQNYNYYKIYIYEKEEHTKFFELVNNKILKS